jgi:hypothetical protein
MTLPTWPDTLPPLRGQVAGLGSPQLYAPPSETQMEDGPARSRRRTLVATTTRTMVLTLTPPQFAAFLAFARDTLNGGAGRFTAEIVTAAGTRAVRVCKIVGAPAEAAAGAHHRVSFNLLIWDW